MLFIDTDGGRVKRGGWNAVGLKKVKALNRAIKASRDDDENPHLEAACLNRLRTTHDIVARDLRRLEGRGKKRKAPEDPVSEDECDQL